MLAEVCGKVPGDQAGTSTEKGHEERRRGSRAEMSKRGGGRFFEFEFLCFAVVTFLLIFLLFMIHIIHTVYTCTRTYGTALFIDSKKGPGMIRTVL